MVCPFVIFVFCALFCVVFFYPCHAWLEANAFLTIYIYIYEDGGEETITLSKEVAEMLLADSLKLQANQTSIVEKMSVRRCPDSLFSSNILMEH